MTLWSTRTSYYVRRSHAIELQCISFHVFLCNGGVSVCIYNDAIDGLKCIGGYELVHKVSYLPTLIEQFQLKIPSLTDFHIYVQAKLTVLLFV